MKILVYGALNIDLVYKVDHIARPGETIASIGFEKSAGGKGANQAAALAKAGMDVSLAGKIGEDGLFLLELLGSYGVNTEKVIIYGGATGQALIQVDRSGQNSIILHAGGNGEIQKSEISRVLESFGMGDAVLLQNEIPLSGEIIGSAKERGMKVFLNPSPYDEGIEKMPLDQVDVFFLNEIEGAALASLPVGTAPPLALDRLTSRFPRAEIILTAGRDGAYYGKGRSRERAEIVSVPVVDTTGAGDTFTGFFLAARERQFPAAKALWLSCKAASIAVSRKGAMESIPFMDEVF